VILPEPKLTPGDVFEVTLQDICTRYVTLLR
jgi:hypothetical protein